MFCKHYYLLIFLNFDRISVLQYFPEFQYFNAKVSQHLADCELALKYFLMLFSLLAGNDDTSSSICVCQKRLHSKCSAGVWSGCVDNVRF